MKATRRASRIVFALFLAVFVATAGSANAPRSYRAISDLDLGVFACSPDPGHLLFASASQLAEGLERLAPHCRAADFEARKARFLSSLEGESVRWEEEALVVVQDWYGTGMARGRLELAEAPAGVLRATIVWKVPPPPVTPDTTVFRSAFVVRKDAITRVEIRGRDSRPVILPVPRS